MAIARRLIAAMRGRRAHGVRHPYILGMACASVAVDFMFFLVAVRMTGSLFDLPFFLAYCVITILLAFDPRRMSVLLVVYSMTCNMLPRVDSAQMMIGVWLAIALLFTQYRTPVAMGVTAVNVATVLGASTLMGRGRPLAGLAVTLFQVASAIAGYAVNRHREDTKERERRLRLSRSMARVSVLERDMRIASRLHDTLTNDLSYVTMVAYGALASSPSRQDERRWRGIIASMDDAFRRAHEAIAVLDSDADTSDTTPTVDASDVEGRIRRTIDANTGELGRMGFSGRCTVTAASDPHLLLAKDMMQETVDLLAEIFANIRRHCTPGLDTYTLHVAFTRQGIELTQMNTWHAPSGENGQRSSGLGLDLHRRTITLGNGTFDTSLEDHAWTLFARIPWSGENEACAGEPGMPSHLTAHAD